MYLSGTRNISTLQPWHTYTKGTNQLISHFTVVSLIPRPMNAREARTDVALIQNSAFLIKMPTS